MKSYIGLVGVVLVLITAIAAGYGWVMNIVTIFGGSFDPLTGVMVLRCVGIFVAPLGAVMGYIG